MSWNDHTNKKSNWWFPKWPKPGFVPCRGMGYSSFLGWFGDSMESCDGAEPGFAVGGAGPFFDALPGFWRPSAHPKPKNPGVSPKVRGSPCRWWHLRPQLGLCVFVSLRPWQVFF